MNKFISVIFLFALASILLISCQKEITGTTTGGGNGGGGTIGKKPKLGTQWMYRYSTFRVDGSLGEAHQVVYKAMSEDQLGGETWLNIVDTNTHLTVFLLNEKTGGLYHYANNVSNLLCKYPAIVSDTYNTFNGSATVGFTVTGVNDTLQFLLGDLAVTHYEGRLQSPTPGAPQIVDQIWYNENVWIAQRYYYTSGLFGNVYRKSASIILDYIIY
jgi:hypothetical protein